MAGEKVAPDGFGNILNAANLLIPAIFGSGTTTTKVSSDPGAISSLTGIMNSANAAADDDSATDAMVNNIMRQAAIQFAPTLGAEKTAGLYNSSTVQQLADQSKADATGAASKAVLDYKTQQRGIAAQAAAALANASRTQTSKTGPSVNPGISGALGAAMTAKSLFTNRNNIMNFIKDPVSTTKSWLDIGKEGNEGAAPSGVAGSDVVSNGSGVFDPATRAGIGADPTTVSPTDYVSPTTAASTITSTDLGAPVYAPTGQETAANIDAGASAAGLSAANVGSSDSLQPIQGSIPFNTGNLSPLGNPANDGPISATSAATAADVAGVTDSGSAAIDTASSIDDAADLTQVADTASSIDDAADVAEGADNVGTAIEAGSTAADAAEAADTGIEAASAASNATPYGLILTAISAISQAFGGPSAGEAFSAVNNGFEEFTKNHDSELYDIQSNGDEGIASLFQGDLGGVADSQVNMVSDQIDSITNGDVLNNITDTFNPMDVASDVGDAFDTIGSSSVICTEAQKQGLLDVNLARWEMQRNLLRLSDLTLRGYQLIAVPFVHKMRKDRHWAVFLSRQANAYCNEICFKSGGFVGKFLRFVGEPICWIIGVGLLMSGKLEEVSDMVQKELYRHG